MSKKSENVEFEIVCYNQLLFTNYYIIDHNNMAIFMAILIILFGLLWYYLNRFRSYVYSLGIPVLSGFINLINNAHAKIYALSLNHYLMSVVKSIILAPIHPKSASHN